MHRFLACLMLTTLPAAALVPEPFCGINLTDGTIGPYVPPYAQQPVWPEAHRGAVITYDWQTPRDRIDGAVQLCPGGQAVRYSMPEAAHQAMRPQVYEMLESDTTYTLADIRDRIREAGGNAWLSATQGLCGCDSMGW